MLYAVVALAFLGASDGEVSSGVFGVHLLMMAVIIGLIVFCLRDISKAANGSDSSGRTLWTVVILMVSLIGVPLYLLLDPLRNSQAEAGN